ncbi:hypothetical protein BBP40_010041 [Aspergillus hancockii]|nr:hypothetical protein BBP40_010041 [Aspergillus hancockii]
MNPKAYPPRLDDLGRPSLLPGEIGSWRAHMNAIQKIVSERLTSALILEDDIDWDITLKNQLQGFALGSRAIQKKTRLPETPYGGDWDLLWLGHCGINCYRDRPFYMMHDQTAVPAAHLPHYWHGPAINKGTEETNHSRIVCGVSDSVCTYAYALTFHAAQKILAELSVSPSNQAMPPAESIVFDVVLGRLCKIGYLKCISSYPSLIGNWKPPGSRSKHSDIQEIQDAPAVEDTEEKWGSSGVMYSMMSNIRALLDAEPPAQPSVVDIFSNELKLREVQPMEGGLYKLDNGRVDRIAG